MKIKWLILLCLCLMGCSEQSFNYVEPTLPASVERVSSRSLFVFENRARGNKVPGAPLAWYEPDADNRDRFDNAGLVNSVGVWLYEEDSVDYWDLVALADFIQYTDASEDMIRGRIEELGRKSDERLRSVGIHKDYFGIVLLDVERWPIHSGVRSGGMFKFQADHNVPDWIIDRWEWSFIKL